MHQPSEGLFLCERNWFCFVVAQDDRPGSTYLVTLQGAPSHTARFHLPIGTREQIPALVFLKRPAVGRRWWFSLRA